jgi:Flp pilus assembly protein TadD
MPPRNSNQRWLVCALLAVLTLAVYFRVVELDFVSYDDDVYVTANSRIQSGLSWDNLVWAFSSTSAANWHPMTWLSHMLDCGIFGLKPEGHHLTNLVIHLANVLLLFWVLQLMTGALWPCALVAALFAVHPLNVESVAWVAERKNLLSTFFWILTLWAYVWYAARPGLKRYVAVVGLFALGLMSKPMVVTLPFVLLLLDYWPLRRLAPPASESGAESKRAAKRSHTAKLRPDYPRRSLPGLLLEKAPLILLAAGASVITVIAQKKGGAVGAIEVFSISARITNAVVSYADYLRQMIWPAGLAVIYPHPKEALPVWHVAASAIALVSITALVLWRATRERYAVVGWLWYLGTLVPVIGLVQVGLQARADRYAYVPLIGLFVLIVWAGFDYSGKGGFSRKWSIGISVCVVGLLSVVTHLHLNHWRNSISLFQHAVDVTDNNAVAHNNLGELLAGRGRLDEAAAHFTRAVEINPEFDQALHNSGMMLAQQRRLDEAIEQFSKTVEINPRFLEAYNKLGAALAERGRLDEAVAALSKALELNPNYPSAHGNMALVLEQQGKLDEAIAHYSEALRYMANIGMSAQTHYRVGSLLVKKGEKDQAVAHYREALRLKPDYSQAKQALDSILNSSDREEGK